MWLSTSTSTRSIEPTKPTCSALAGEPDRRLAVAVEPLHDVCVELAEQDHAGDLDGLGVGDAEPLVEADLEAEALHVFGDLRAASVNDDGIQADVLEQHDVCGESLHQLLLAHRRAAVLDHHGAAVELPDVGKRLEERAYIRINRSVHPASRRRPPFRAAKAGWPARGGRGSERASSPVVMGASEREQSTGAEMMFMSCTRR
jgi:hypothetical protein